MNKINKWLNKKKNEDTAITQFLKLCYSLGQKSWLHATIASVFGIIIPIFF